MILRVIDWSMFLLTPLEGGKTNRRPWVRAGGRDGRHISQAHNSSMVWLVKVLYDSYGPWLL